MATQLRSERAAQLGPDTSSMAADAWFATQMLALPASPYSDLIDRPEFTNELYWWAVVDSQPRPADEDATLAALATELGFTRARPGADVQPAPGFRDPFVGAHAAKAGLDADIFWHVLDMFGYDRAIHFASHAFGVQVLRDQIRSVPAERQGAMGIYTEVHARFMKARHVDALSDHDLRYLDALAQDRLLHPAKHPGLPAAWRIARIAAAFRDARGYVGGAPCHRDGSPDTRYAGTREPGDTRTPCLVAVHDRALHRWYVDELRSLPPPPPVSHGGLARLGALLGALLPLLDMVALVEVVEAAVADDMVAIDAATRIEAETAAERATRFTCAIPD